jgi:hypothetical protein
MMRDIKPTHVPEQLRVSDKRKRELKLEAMVRRLDIALENFDLSAVK